MKFEKKDFILIGVLAVLIISLIIVEVINHKDNNNTSDKVDYVVLNDASTFFTLESAANKYINALCSLNKSNLMKLLNTEYIEENLINESNVLNKLDKLDGSYILRVKKIYQEKIDNNYNKYYIYGLLQKEVIDVYDYGTDYYLIMNVDSKHNLFSITPYDGEVFKES